MKCSQCSKQATFHITDITGDEVLALHLCPDCAKQYLQSEEGDQSQATQMSDVISSQLSPLQQATDEMRELDQKKCPICGISFYEFRQGGRLGCPHDYIFFGDELESLLFNVHGGIEHCGKHPKRGVQDVESQTQLIRLRREMKEAIEQERYEAAGHLRDQIREIENQGRND